MSFLQKIDALADEEAPIHRLNISGDRVYRSALGGFCTLMIGVTFLLLLYSESSDVINKKYPFVQSKPVKDDLQFNASLTKDLPPIYITIRDAARYYKLDRTKLDLYVTQNFQTLQNKSYV